MTKCYCQYFAGGKIDLLILLTDILPI
jgi:hypothetical protein